MNLNRIYLSIKIYGLPNNINNFLKKFRLSL